MAPVRAISWFKTIGPTVGVALSLAACATAPPPRSAPSMGRLADGRPRAYNRPYQVRGRWYTPADQPGYDRVGIASWYNYESSSKTTANGERFDARLATAAHTTLPIPSWLEVTNLDNGRSARVRLNDRGPFVSGRILDVSRAAALELGFLGHGTARVRVRYLGPAGPFGAAPPRWAKAEPLTPPPASSAMQMARAKDGASSRMTARDEVREDLAAASAEDENMLPDPVASKPSSIPVGETGAGGAGLMFAVQAGAFSDRVKAERAAERLARTGGASIRPLARPNGAVLYRVVVGAWPEAAEAVSARSHIAALGFVDAQVVTR